MWEGAERVAVRPAACPCWEAGSGSRGPCWVGSVTEEATAVPRGACDSQSSENGPWSSCPHLGEFRLWFRV